MVQNSFDLDDLKLEGYDWLDAELFFNDSAFDFTSQDSNNLEQFLSELEIIFTLYLPPVISILGLLFNVLVIMPTVELVLSPISCPLHIYSALIIVLHSLLLSTSYSIQWVDMVFAGRRLREIRLISHLHCQLSLYLEKVLLGSDRWLVACLIIECFVLLRNSERAFDLTRRNVHDTVIFVFVSQLIIHMHYFWTHEVEHGPITFIKKGHCKVRAYDLRGEQTTKTYGLLLTQISPVFGDIMPSLLVIITFAMMLKMFLRRRSHSRMKNARCLQSPQKRMSYFITDCDSYDDMARRVGFTLAISHFVCIAPKVLVIQLLDDFVFRFGNFSITSMTFIGVVANTVEAIYYSLPLVIFLINSRACRQLLRYKVKTLRSKILTIVSALKYQFFT